jgi:hypothetical protein
MAYESAISRGELPMDIEIEWQNPVQLTKFKKVIVHENHLPETIEDRAGVYFFSRKFGRHYIPFYIGETGKIRARLKGHLNWAKLVDVLRGMRVGDKKIKQGDRYFHYGYLITKKKQNKKKCIQLVQKYLVREAVAQNTPLLNKKLVVFKTNSLNFNGSKKARGVYGKHVAVE